MVLVLDGKGTRPQASCKAPKDHIDTRISHSGSKAQYKGDIRNHGWKDPYVYVVFWGPKLIRLLLLVWVAAPRRCTRRGSRSAAGGRAPSFRAATLWSF